MGRDTYTSVERVDFDAKTLHVVADNVSPKGRHVDQTLVLSAFDVKRLGELADRARHEIARGTIPSSDDAWEALSIVDGDDVFDIRGDLIGGGRYVRPEASKLAQAILDYAGGPLAQTAPPPPKHKHAVDRSTLQTPGTTARLPLHGVAVHVWGLGGDQTIVIDSDKATVRQISNLMGKPPRDDMYEGNGKQIDQIMQLAFAAWDEDGSEMPMAPDIREDLYVLDGDEAFFLSGHPIAANGKIGRPLAMKAVSAVFHEAR